MKVVFMLDDGRTVAVDATQVQLTCPDPTKNVTHLTVSGTDGQQYIMINFPCGLKFASAPSPVDAEVEWLEELWKLEDKR